MSKWKQITKTRRLKARRDPSKRIARITELKREIKLYLDNLASRVKTAQELERQARSARWEVEGLKRTISEYEKELDRGKRKLIGYEIQKLLSQELPLIFTVTEDRIFAIKNKWGNFNPTVNFYPSVWPKFEYMYEIDKGQ